MFHVSRFTHYEKSLLNRQEKRGRGIIGVEVHEDFLFLLSFFPCKDCEITYVGCRGAIVVKIPYAISKSSRS
jgi:hypothetical protein